MDADEVCDEIDCSPEVYNPDQDCSNIDSHQDNSKQLIKTTDILGRNIHNQIDNILIFDIYNDGSVEKKWHLKK